MISLKELIPPAGIIRTLCLSHVSKTAANGVLMSVSVLYFTRTVHIPATQVGLALTFGAALGLLVAIPSGRLADARGPRGVTVGVLCLLGLFVSGYLLVDSFTGLLIVTALVFAGEAAVEASGNALIAGLLPPNERVRASSYMRAAANVSVVIGAAAGGLALYLDTHTVYLALLLGAGVLFVAAGLAYLSVPVVPPVPHTGDGPVWPVLRDLPYATACLLNTVLIMNSGILTIALPIWITTRTDAPAWLFPCVIIVNATSVVLLQVRVSRGSETVSGGARALRWSGFTLAGACALFALAAGVPVWLAVVVLLLGALVHVIAEMLHAAGAWALGFGLAPEHLQGQYQGLFAVSSQLGQMAAPALVTLLLTGLGAGGWAVLAVLFVLTGAVAPVVGGWALSTRSPALATPRQPVSQ